MIQVYFLHLKFKKNKIQMILTEYLCCIIIMWTKFPFQSQKWGFLMESVSWEVHNPLMSHSIPFSHWKACSCLLLDLSCLTFAIDCVAGKCVYYLPKYTKQTKEVFSDSFHVLLLLKCDVVAAYIGQVGMIGFLTLKQNLCIQAELIFDVYDTMNSRPSFPF